MLIIHI